MAVTIHRFFLDNILLNNQDLFKGHILDVGGMKINGRGKFNKHKVRRFKSWIYLNVSKNTDPDILASAEEMPVKAGSIDTVLMSEVVEYVYDLSKVLNEVYRVLKNDGIFILTTPFLVPLHGDKDADNYRFTITYLKNKLSLTGFKIINCYHITGLWGIIYDFLHIYFGYANKNKESYFIFKLARKVLSIFRPLLIFLEKIFPVKNDYLTSGYIIILRK